jgi:hypothetical protein
VRILSHAALVLPVRLGKSGLKISRIVLGCMTYGSPEWAGWVLGEEDGIAHIKAAYDAGINAFDTANVRSRSFCSVRAGLTDVRAGVLERLVRGYPRQSDQAPQTAAGRNRGHDEGAHVLEV